MNKKIIIIASVIIVFVIIIVTWLVYSLSTVSVSKSANSLENSSYIIENQKVTLVNGISEITIPGSAEKIITRYFGNAVTSDLNGDGRPDSAFILTQNTGGSGTFYYVVAALNTPNGYIG